MIGRLPTRSAHSRSQHAMPDASPGQQIQTEPTASVPPGRISPRSRTRLAGSLLGSLAGILLGAQAGAGALWLADYGDYGWTGALCGAAAGIVGGAVIGFLERALRGDLVRPDVATITGAVFGAAIALIILLLALGGAYNRVSARLLLGILFIPPAAG